MLGMALWRLTLEVSGTTRRGAQGQE